MHEILLTFLFYRLVEQEPRLVGVLHFQQLDLKGEKVNRKKKNVAKTQVLVAMCFLSHLYRFHIMGVRWLRN